MAESLRCLYETITELLTGCTPVQNLKSLNKRTCSPRIITEKLSSRITSFPDQGLNLSLALAGGFFITEPPGKPQVFIFSPGVSSLTVAS